MGCLGHCSPAVHAPIPFPLLTADGPARPFLWSPRSDGAGNALELLDSGTNNVMNSLVIQSNGGRAPGRYCYGISSTITTACAVNNGARAAPMQCTNLTHWRCLLPVFIKTAHTMFSHSQATATP